MAWINGTDPVLVINLVDGPVTAYSEHLPWTISHSPIVGLIISGLVAAIVAVAFTQTEASAPLFGRPRSNRAGHDNADQRVRRDVLPR